MYRINEETGHDGIPLTRLRFIRIRFASVYFLEITCAPDANREYDPGIPVSFCSPATSEKLTVGGRGAGGTSGIVMDLKSPSLSRMFENEWMYGYKVCSLMSFVLIEWM